MENKSYYKKILLGFIFIVVVIGVLLLFQGSRRMLPTSNNGVALPIPPQLEDLNPAPNIGEFHLVAKRSTKDFGNGIRMETFGYNGDYLGPVIRVKKGENVTIKVDNLLDETTTVHWHGMEISGDADGGPIYGIKPSEVWTTRFTINQPAATLWFHPHPIHQTGAQVYKGLAGLIYIDDEFSERLKIPKTYGQNDFPIIIQDRRLKNKDDLSYNPGMMDIMHGFQGDTVLINGAINPYLEVPKGKVRLRILNGSNGRNYDVHLTQAKLFLANCYGWRFA